MKEHITCRPGIEKNGSRAREHHVLRDSTGRVISELFPDTSEARIKFRAVAGESFEGKPDFLGFGDVYISSIKTKYIC